MELKAKDKIIVAVLVVLAIVVFVGGRYHDNHTGFTTEKWVNAEGNERQLILQDLVDRTRFAGMKRAEVKELLGEADDEAEGYLIYKVGMPQGLFGTEADSQPEYFVVELDKDDVVTASGVMIADVLPKDSEFRIIGEETDDTVLHPEEKK